MVHPQPPTPTKTNNSDVAQIYFLLNPPSEREWKFKISIHLHTYYESMALQERLHFYTRACTKIVIFLKDEILKK